MAVTRALAARDARHDESTRDIASEASHDLEGIARGVAGAATAGAAGAGLSGGDVGGCAPKRNVSTKPRDAAESAARAKASFAVGGSPATPYGAIAGGSRAREPGRSDAVPDTAPLTNELRALMDASPCQSPLDSDLDAEGDWMGSVVSSASPFATPAREALGALRDRQRAAAHAGAPFAEEAVREMERIVARAARSAASASASACASGAATPLSRTRPALPPPSLVAKRETRGSRPTESNARANATRASRESRAREASVAPAPETPSPDTAPPSRRSPRARDGSPSAARSASASHRYSYELPENDEFAGQLVEHVGASLTNLGILHPERHVIGGTTLLLSKRGAPRQSWHTDYKWWNRIFTSKGLVPGCHCVPYPVSVLIALHEEGAWLRVRDGEDIFVPQYGAVVFRGDLTHAGAEWTGASFNWRIHLYYDTQGTSWTSWSCKVPRVGREARGGRHIQVIKPPARAERAAAAA